MICMGDVKIVDNSFEVFLTTLMKRGLYLVKKNSII